MIKVSTNFPAILFLVGDVHWFLAFVNPILTIQFTAACAIFRGETTLLLKSNYSKPNQYYEYLQVKLVRQDQKSPERSCC